MESTYLNISKNPISYSAIVITGEEPGFTLTTHQQTLTIGPFGNTYKEDEVSPKVEIGGCRTQVSKTKGNEK
jgi:hypothetical protein